MSASLRGWVGALSAKEKLRLASGHTPPFTRLFLQPEEDLSWQADDVKHPCSGVHAPVPILI
jgi:hypothetical protein